MSTFRQMAIFGLTVDLLVVQPELCDKLSLTEIAAHSNGESFMLSTILTVLLILTVLILLLLITVFQHGNEGGIGSAFGSGNSAGFFGASGGANLIVRATWIFGSLFFILATSLAWVRTHDSFGVSREIDSALDSGALDAIDAAKEAVIKPDTSSTEATDPAAEAVAPATNSTETARETGSGESTESPADSEDSNSTNEE